MQPKYQIERDECTIPKMEIKERDVESFIEKLKGFHSEFEDCFKRKEARNKFYQYMVGQFSELERKSIEPIALKVEGGNVRNMQRLLSYTRWEEEKMLSKYHKLVKEDMGDEDGVLIFDESGFRKKGKESVGVARQYCGTLGKVDNCQVGVFMAYASRYGYSFLEKKLFIPEKWFEEDYKDRREKCKIPAEVKFKTKPQLAIEMFNEV